MLSPHTLLFSLMLIRYFRHAISLFSPITLVSHATVMFIVATVVSTPHIIFSTATPSRIPPATA